jgi:hypothetical protein
LRIVRGLERYIKGFYTSPYRDFVRFSQFNLFQFPRLTALLAVWLLFAGCATRKPAAAPPPPTFPPTSANTLQELRSLPQAPYDRLEVATVVGETGEQLGTAIKSARESAAAKGANALVILRDVEFKQRVGKRTLRLRRITYLAIHRR